MSLLNNVLVNLDKRNYGTSDADVRGGPNANTPKPDHFSELSLETAMSPGVSASRSAAHAAHPSDIADTTDIELEPRIIAVSFAPTVVSTTSPAPLEETKQTDALELDVVTEDFVAAAGRLDRAPAYMPAEEDGFFRTPFPSQNTNTKHPSARAGSLAPRAFSRRTLAVVGGMATLMVVATVAFGTWSLTRTAPPTQMASAEAVKPESTTVAPTPTVARPAVVASAAPVGPTATVTQASPVAHVAAVVALADQPKAEPTPAAVAAAQPSQAPPSSPTSSAMNPSPIGMPIDGPTAQVPNRHVAALARADGPPPPVRMYTPSAGTRAADWPQLVNPVEPTGTAARPAATTPATPTVEARVEKRERPTSAHDIAESHYQRGLSSHQQGNTEDAVTSFSAAVTAEPTHQLAREALALEMATTGRTPQALTILADGIRLAPNSLSLDNVLARVQVNVQDLSGAVSTLSVALARAQPNALGAATTRALQATLLQRLGRYDEAAQGYRKALVSAPGNQSAGAWWLGMGVALAGVIATDPTPEKVEAARDAFEHARTSPSLSAELRQYAEQRLAGLPPKLVDETAKSTAAN